MVPKSLALPRCHYVLPRRGPRQASATLCRPRSVCSKMWTIGKHSIVRSLYHELQVQRRVLKSSFLAFDTFFRTGLGSYLVRGLCCDFRATVYDLMQRSMLSCPGYSLWFDARLEWNCKIQESSAVIFKRHLQGGTGTGFSLVPMQRNHVSERWKTGSSRNFAPCCVYMFCKVTDPCARKILKFNLI